MNDLTEDQRTHRMNIRNAYYSQPKETLQSAIDCAKEKKSCGWDFKVECLEELKGEHVLETNDINTIALNKVLEAAKRFLKISEWLGYSPLDKDGCSLDSSIFIIEQRLKKESEL